MFGGGRGWGFGRDQEGPGWWDYLGAHRNSAGDNYVHCLDFDDGFMCISKLITLHTLNMWVYYISITPQ